MVLTQVRTNGDYVIHAINSESETRHHLEGLGFVPGAKLKVVSRIGDSLIVSVKGSKVALDAHLAKCVMV